MRERAHAGARALCRTAAATLAFALTFLPPMPASAAAGFVEILRTSTYQLEGVWYLDAEIAWSPGDEAKEALDSGLTLDVRLSIELTRRRALLWDPAVAELEQRYDLRYHALTQRFIVRNLNSGEQATYGSLQAALREIGEVRGLPVIDDSLLEDDGEYDVGLQAELDMKQLGGPLALIGFLWNDWGVASEWVRWPLER